MRVVIATGGTGGHIFPALKVAAEFRQRGHDVTFVGAFRDWRERIHGEGFVTKEIHIRGLNRRSLFELVGFGILMIKGVWDSFFIIKRLRPQVVVGFGGYGAFPVVLTAAVLGHPTLIHEQNVVPGKANKLLSRMVRRIAVSFERSKRYFPTEKTVLTGCPCLAPSENCDRRKSLAKFALRDDRKTILVLGGSQGSHRINREFVNVLKSLAGEFPLQIVHISGKMDYNELKEHYEGMRIPYCLYDFLMEIDQAYCAADVVVSRAGALTATEIALAHRPAVLIPYPHAQNHQKENAFLLQEAGIARVIEEKDLTQESLRQAIAEALKENPGPGVMKQRADAICLSDAAKRIVQEAVQLYDEKNHG